MESNKYIAAILTVAYYSGSQSRNMDTVVETYCKIIKKLKEVPPEEIGSGHAEG